MKVVFKQIGHRGIEKKLGNRNNLHGSGPSNPIKTSCINSAGKLALPKTYKNKVFDVLNSVFDNLREVENEIEKHLGI